MSFPRYYFYATVFLLCKVLWTTEEADIKIGEYLELNPIFHFMKITFLQAGNGDCILLQGGGRNVLIDSGKELSEAFDHYRKGGKAHFDLV